MVASGKNVLLFSVHLWEENGQTLHQTNGWLKYRDKEGSLLKLEEPETLTSSDLWPGDKPRESQVDTEFPRVWPNYISTS